MRWCGQTVAFSPSCLSLKTSSCSCRSMPVEGYGQAAACSPAVRCEKPLLRIAVYGIRRRVLPSNAFKCMLTLREECSPQLRQRSPWHSGNPAYITDGLAGSAVKGQDSQSCRVGNAAVICKHGCMRAATSRRSRVLLLTVCTQ